MDCLLSGQCRIKSYSDRNAEVDIKTDMCAAYETTTLTNQKVPMKENPAYEEIRHYTVNFK